MKERIVLLMIMAICLSGYALTANAQSIEVGEFTNAHRGGGTEDTVAFSWVAGDNSCLVVMPGGEYRVTSAPVTSVTFAGEALTQAVASFDPGGSSYADIWYLVGPAATSGDIVVSYGGSIQEGRTEIGAVILHNVDPITPLVQALANGSGGSATVSVNIDAVEGGILVDSFEQNDNETSATPRNGQTVLYLVDGLDGGAAAGAGYRLITVDGQTDEGWNIGSPNERNVLAVASFAPLVDPSYNPAPKVDAGPDQTGYTDEVFQLNGTVSDTGPRDGTSPGSPGGVESFYWTQKSGAGTAEFSATDILDPTVTFDAAGSYQLLLQATDGIKDGNDIMVVLVQVRALVGHWPFDVDGEDVSINDNHGTFVEGAHIDAEAAVGAGSVNTMITVGDPNLPHVALGAATELDFGVTDWTVSAWIKTTQSGTGDANKGAIFANGGDSGDGHRYCLILNESNSGRVRLVTDDDSTKVQARTSGSNLVNDDRWHFILGVRDGDETRIYRDGIFDDDRDLPAGYDLSGTSQLDSYIGIISDWNGSREASTLYKHFNGLIDDVRVYNYALAMEDPDNDDIMTLAAMSELVASVNAGSNDTYQLKPGESIPLVGIVTDYGAPGPIEDIMWETITGPEGTDAVIADPGALVTTATFPEFGVYTLRLTVTDVNSEMIVWDEVTLTIVSPTCADVISEGLLMAGDISGPEGTPDCRVDIYDFAAFAADFLRCVDPQGDCEDPWNGG